MKKLMRLLILACCVVLPLEASQRYSSIADDLLDYYEDDISKNDWHDGKKITISYGGKSISIQSVDKNVVAVTLPCLLQGANNPLKYHGYGGLSCGYNAITNGFSLARYRTSGWGAEALLDDVFPAESGAIKKRKKVIFKLLEDTLAHRIAWYRMMHESDTEKKKFRKMAWETWKNRPWKKLYKGIGKSGFQTIVGEEVSKQKGTDDIQEIKRVTALSMEEQIAEAKKFDLDKRLFIENIIGVEWKGTARKVFQQLVFKQWQDKHIDLRMQELKRIERIHKPQGGLGTVDDYELDTEEAKRLYVGVPKGSFEKIPLHVWRSGAGAEVTTDLPAMIADFQKAGRPQVVAITSGAHWVVARVGWMNKKRWTKGEKKLEIVGLDSAGGAISIAYVKKLAKAFLTKLAEPEGFDWEDDPDDEPQPKKKKKKKKKRKPKIDPEQPGEFAEFDPDFDDPAFIPGPVVTQEYEPEPTKEEEDKPKKKKKEKKKRKRKVKEEEKKKEEDKPKKKKKKRRKKKRKIDFPKSEPTDVSEVERRTVAAQLKEVLKDELSDDLDLFEVSDDQEKLVHDALFERTAGLLAGMAINLQAVRNALKEVQKAQELKDFATGLIMQFDKESYFDQSPHVASDVNNYANTLARLIKDYAEEFTSEGISEEGTSSSDEPGEFPDD